MIKIIVCILYIVSCIFVSPSLALDDSQLQLEDVIKSYILSKHPEWTGLAINITFKSADKTFAYLQGLEGNVNIEILEGYKDFKPVGSVIFPVKISGKNKSKKIFLRTKVEIIKEVVVARHYIARKAIITKDDVKLGKRDIAMLPPNSIDDVKYIIGSETKTSISTKSVIFPWMYKAEPQLHRGDKVVIRVIAPNLLVKTDGIALGDGYVGRKLKVKRKGTKVAVEGILVSSNVVEVRLK